MIEFNQKKSVRGGQRPGAGRPAGAASKKTREIADRAAAQGITPLEVMIEAMQDAYAHGGAAAAFMYAKDAAPYMHAKLSSAEMSGKGGKDLMGTQPSGVLVVPGVMTEADWEKMMCTVQLTST
jgi:hypothetical protein